MPFVDELEKMVQKAASGQKEKTHKPGRVGKICRKYTVAISRCMGANSYTLAPTIKRMYVARQDAIRWLISLFH